MGLIRGRELNGEVGYLAMGTYLFGVSLSLDTLEQAAEDLGAVERVLVEMYNPIVRARFGQRVVRPKYPSGGMAACDAYGVTSQWKCPATVSRFYRMQLR